MEDSLHLFFDGWGPLLRIPIVGVLSYFALISLVRVSGARTLASMNPLDLAITVALGSTFGRLLTAEDVTLAEAVVAFVVLIGLQVTSTLLMRRVPALERLLTPPPSLVYYRGEFLRGNMRRGRISETELRAAAREHGIGSLGEVEAIAVESNGNLAVIGKSRAGDGSALRGVEGER